MTSKKLFFSGIGGSGMSAIAGFMKARGNIVSGSDRAFDAYAAQGTENPLMSAFKRMGIAIFPQDGSGVDKTLDLLVTSTAVEADRPEIVKARELGITMATRPDYLASIASSYRTIAVSGTSGKSTASGMLAFLMQKLGMSPNFIGGGRVKALEDISATGNYLAGRSDAMVIEACESDGTIVNYRPESSIVLNLHIDHKGMEETAGMFRALVRNTASAVITNADDENLKRESISGAIAFSIDRPSEYRAGGVKLMPFGSAFTLRGVRYELSVPGRFNIYNALPCLAIMLEAGAATADLAQALKEFTGIRRRFDVVLNEGGKIVIDDYAHNPHKIAALMKAARLTAPYVRYVFQPHGFAPTRMMREEYIEAFADNLRAEDHLVLLPIYYAGGTVQTDISSDDLLEGIRGRGGSAEVIEDRAELVRGAGEWPCHVVMGARDETLTDLARDIAQALKVA